MEPKLLLFDIDGTLLRSGGAGMRAMSIVAERLYGPGFTWDGIKPGGNLDPLIFAAAAKANRIDGGEASHARFRDEYLRQLPIELKAAGSAVQAMPGVHDLLTALRPRRHAVMGLLTGNYTEAVPIKLSAIGVETSWFTLTSFGDEAPTRRDMVALALDRWSKQRGHKVDPRHVAVIGDTLRDIDCAQAHGCVAMAVATGPVSYNDLAAAKPDVLMRDFTDPSPVLSWVG
ncbi:MAG: haloacid dehalogenase-like hydrolase [Phycisphaeraceae bacterium]|nr:haloacid dehalogenase-like hydrolase [Phycisphaeraceae bacterium]